jgi:hypothetical protein
MHIYFDTEMFVLKTCIDTKSVKCVLAQDDRKLTKYVSDIPSICLKTNYVKIKKLHWHIICWKSRKRSAMHSLFLSCLVQFSEEFLCHGKRQWRFVCHRKIGKCVFKHFLAIYVRMRSQRFFDSENSLHLWRRHPCTWLSKGNRRTDTHRLQHDVTCVGCCTVTGILCVC